MLTSLEIKRQLMHILLGIAIVFLINFNLINSTILFIILIIGLILSLSSRKFHIPIIHRFLKIFDRKKDIEEFPGKGAIFYLLGVFLVVLIFPKETAMASIMILALGDSISRLVGPYGYLKHPFTNTKFFEGVIAGAIVGFLGALIFVPWILAFVGSLVSMLLEGLDLRIKGFKMDDNLLIPIVAAVVMESVKVLI
jgi:dolichol kinase